MHSIFYFDTEDSVSPPEAGSDDIVFSIAELLTRHRLQGSFHIIGDKARCLEERGRSDVIEAVAHHDVSSHFNHGSVHPTTVELVSVAGWDEGVRIALQEEELGFRDIKRIFGKCSGLTRHGGSYAPQIVRAAGMSGKPYYGVPFEMPHHRAFWFCGTLVFSILGLVVDYERDHPGHFEGFFENDALFETRLNNFASVLSQTMEKWEFTSLFGAHPHRLLTTKFSCWNHYNGVNRNPPIAPPLRPARERKVVWKNFTKLVEYLANVPGLHIQGLSGLTQTFGNYPKKIPARCLNHYAEKVRESSDVPFDEFFSPAELLAALADSLIHFEEDGVLPEQLEVRKVIGPTQVPASCAVSASQAEVTRMAKFIRQHIRHYGALPAVIEITGKSTGPSEALFLLAQVYDDLASGRTNSCWVTSIREPFPSIAQDWANRTARLKEWRVFGNEMNFENIAELTRCQTWSVKPAHT